MRIVRATGGALLWIVASVVCLLAIILCVTVVLLPLGIPLLMVGRRLFGQSIRLFLPPGAVHPMKHSGKAAKSATRSVVDAVNDQLSNVPRPDGRKARKQVKKGKKRLTKVARA